ncbi:MAG: chalcone isomerase family protein [Candidatus Thiodiazotropha sp. (ex Dulcina madagascariensis)]|nr:chalcone isomerase family protein [Candidatus Thiodiazotropha sp. (ex Epidulcina cf. delphinae)]MCU7924293.1 chalcone isomerase family protein [Candidatus Thiodiazotropha sp. (ex Dulcina madagascariensis)]MCU7924921.1 chalcone isomerase family protein [Candidatus Thiodiazotropha sp. (ex Dulcina madagascariensis)]MCU7935643.1 chalcone isomerase family protein [Candidatus Thiodiazotropha sp. (ex Dulcina madagascariensis)]
MKRAIVTCLLMLYLMAAEAREIAGISIPEQILRDADKTELVLNGAGIRKKFFFSVYLASLYLQQPTPQVEAAIDTGKPARVEMRVLYSKIEKEKFIEGWNDGFSANLSPEQLQSVRQRLDRFNGMFETLVEGDLIELDYFPEEGTRVTIKGVERGTIPGGDFHQALLKVWLGESPVGQKLKEALLGMH